MSEFSARVSPLLLALILLCTSNAAAATIDDAHWNGNDFVLDFSGDIIYEVDLSQTDTSHVVVRVSNVRPDERIATARRIDGPDGRTAILTGHDQEVLVRLVAPHRIGFSTLWKPYTDRLVIYTFQWDSLDYSQQQYHSGLLALEQGFGETAEELLKVAAATGDPHAAGVLGSYYAREGKEDLARHYLSNPVDAEDFMALAQIERRAGNDKAAEANEKKAAERIEAERRSALAAGTGLIDSSAVADAGSGRAARIEPWVYFVVGGALLALLAIGAIFMFAGRPSKPVAAAGTRTPMSRAPSEMPAVGTVAADRPESIPESSEESAVTAGEPAVVEEPGPDFRVIPPGDAAETQESEAEEEYIPAHHVPHVTTVEELHLSDADVEPAATETRLRPPAVAEEPTIARELRAEEAALESQRETTEAPVPTLEPSEVERWIETAEEATASERIPAQAAELRRRIQSVRRDRPAPAEATITAARRLKVSRDNVELRRLIEESRRSRGPAE